MKKLIIIIAIIFCGMMMQAQEAVTYNQVADKQVKGNLTQYTTESGVVFNLGDTLKIGYPYRKIAFDFITNQNNTYMSGWVGSSRISRARYDEVSDLVIVIKTMKVTGKKLYVTTHSETESLGLNITNFEEAFKLGEVLKPGFIISGDELTDLQKAK